MSRDPEEMWSPDYDSTWEDDEEEQPQGQGEPGNRRQPNNCRRWNRAARDLRNYRHGYVNEKSCQYINNRASQYYSNESQTPNLHFYQNKKCFEPDGLHIDDLLENWKKKYDILERNHSYIQWLFPLREHGMNSYAKPLTVVEIKEMKKEEVQRRFLEAYKLMLDFYGIELQNENTGELIRAENYEERFKNLNDHSHNNLRITRILKCLGELGFERYQAPLVKFFLKETLCECKLQNVKRSVLDYFMFTVKDKTERRKLVYFAWKNYKQERFIWGPVEKLKKYQPPEECETKNGQEGKNDGSDEDSKIDEQDRCEKIPLKNRGEGKEKFSDKGSKATSGMSPISPSHCMNGVQRSTEDVHTESYGEEGNLVSSEVLPKYDHNVPSAVVHQEGKVETLVMDGTTSINRNENLLQDNIPLGTPKKRKMQNVAFDMEGTSVKDSPNSDDHSGMPKEGVDRVKDEVKKLKLIEQPISQGNLTVANCPPCSTAPRDPQQSGDGSDINQGAGECSQMGIPKLHKQPNSDNSEKEECGDSSRSNGLVEIRNSPKQNLV